MRIEGLTFQQIADRLGLGHREIARRAVERALKATVQEPSEELRALELERLDQLWATAWRILKVAHPMVSNGKVVLGEAGVPVPDWRPVLAAIDRLLRVMDRRAALLGLDAARISPAGWSLADIDAEISRLEEGDGQ